MASVAKLARDLWDGRVPLSRTFWEYGVAWNIVVAVAALFAFWMALTSEAPIFVLVIVYLIPVPYHAFALVAMWRSAGRYPGRPILATLARVVAVASTIALVAVP